MVVLQSVAGYLQSDAIIYRKGNSVIFVAFQSLKKIFGKLTQSLTMCWCLKILWPKQTDNPLVSLLFTQGRYRNASVILLLYKICFERENLTRSSAGMGREKGGRLSLPRFPPSHRATKETERERRLGTSQVQEQVCLFCKECD